MGKGKGEGEGIMRHARDCNSHPRGPGYEANKPSVTPYLLAGSVSMPFSSWTHLFQSFQSSFGIKIGGTKRYRNFRLNLDYGVRSMVWPLLTLDQLPGSTSHHFLYGVSMVRYELHPVTAAK
mgnify:CR=1 FL=1